MRALVIEDDPVSARLIEHALKGENMVCEPANCGEDGIDLAKLYDFDIIVLDLRLPDIDGYEVVRRLRGAKVQTPVLILSGNAIVEDAIMTTRKSIERGETISVPLKETKVFPPMVTQMIGVGEATGALDTMLAKIADFYEEEVDTAVAGLLTLLEPIMIAILGIVVGGIVIAMYLPIFDLISKLT